MKTLERVINMTKRQKRAKRKARLQRLNRASIKKNGWGIFKGDKEAVLEAARIELARKEAMYRQMY